LPYDEGPSQEDIDQFSTDETGFCPHCGDEIWDDASQCTACGMWLQTGAVHQDKTTRAFKKKFIAIIVLFILLGFFWGVTRYL